MERARRILRHPLVFYSLVVVGAFLLGVFIFNAIILPRIVGKGSVVIVPRLIGMEQNAAESACRREGLRLVVIGYRNSDEVAEGAVLEQDPLPERGIKEGRTVKVVMSSGRRMEAVPELSGKSLREAELSLQSAGLAPGRVSRIFEPGEGQNIVVVTSPPRGAKLPSGSPVDLLVAMRAGDKRYIMPDLTGRDLPFVRDRLGRLGMSSVRIVTKRDRAHFPNTILAQNPAPGSVIKEGDQIELVVSSVE